MLMPTSHRRAIYEQLFGDGVIVAEKNFIHKLKTHPTVKTPTEPVPNLHVIKTLMVRDRSFTKFLYTLLLFLLWTVTRQLNHCSPSSREASSRSNSRGTTTTGGSRTRASSSCAPSWTSQRRSFPARSSASSARPMLGSRGRALRDQVAVDPRASERRASGREAIERATVGGPNRTKSLRPDRARRVAVAHSYPYVVHCFVLVLINLLLLCLVYTINLCFVLCSTSQILILLQRGFGRGRGGPPPASAQTPQAPPQ